MRLLLAVRFEDLYPDGLPDRYADGMVAIIVGLLGAALFLLIWMGPIGVVGLIVEKHVVGKHFFSHLRAQKEKLSQRLSGAFFLFWSLIVWTAFYALEASTR